MISWYYNWEVSHLFHTLNSVPCFFLLFFFCLGWKLSTGESYNILIYVHSKYLHIGGARAKTLLCLDMHLLHKAEFGTWALDIWIRRI